MAPADEHDLVRIDAARATAPFAYVGSGGIWVQRDASGACHMSGQWSALGRIGMRRALAVLDATPRLRRSILAHWWCVRSAPAAETQLLVIDGEDGLELVRAEATIRWDDVSGISIPGTPRTLTRTHHGDDVMLLAEHYARMRCALGHIARHTP